MIRLATAHAKIRLSKVVTKRDCELALEMLTFTLYNETGKEIDSNEMMKTLDDNESHDENGPKKRNRRIKTQTKNYDNPTNNIKFSDDEMNNKTNLQLSAKKIKRESPEDEVNKIHDRRNQPIDDETIEKSKFIYKIIFDNTKNREFSSIGLEELWTLVSKNKDFSKNNIKDKKDLFNIVIALDVLGKCLYSAEENIVLMI